MKHTQLFNEFLNESKEAEMTISGLVYHQWNDKQAQRQLKDVKFKIISDIENRLTLSGKEKELDKVKSIFGIKESIVNEAVKEVVLSNEILDFLEERGILKRSDAQKVHKDLTAFLKEKGINESLVNEADEVSVDKILTPADKKKLKTAFENVITGIDKLTFKKDGTIEGRRGYFYRHGQSPEGVANQLKAALSGQGIEITIVDSYDDFKSWPKDSNFVVVFKLI